jgi:diguanylate cyclase (GGDEF)-like protein/PAS domain S-box-containing protein
VADAGTGWHREFPLDTPRGRVWLYGSSRPHRRRDGETVWNGLLIDITERKEAEQRLAEAEARQRDINSSLPGAVYQFLHDTDGQHRFTYMSEGLRQLGGLDPDFPIADFEAFLGLVPAEERKGLAAAIAESESSLVPLQREFRLRTPRGTRWVEARSVPGPRPDGSVVCNGLLVDVTERREAQAEAERLSRILAATPDCVATTDRAGRLRYLNPGGRRLLGVGKAEPVDERGFLEFLDPDDGQRLRTEVLRKALRHGAWEGEVTLVVADGTRVAASQTVLCHRDAAGRVTHFSSILRDVSQRAAIEARLRASEARYRSLYHNTPTLLHSIDRQGRLTSVSDYWLEYLGYRREDVIGRPSLDFFTADSRRRALEAVRPGFWERGYCRNEPFQVVGADGTVLDVLLSADCQYDASGEIEQAISVMIDVTDRVAAERGLAASEERLRSLYHNTPVMMHSIDTEGRITDVNDYWLQQLGYAREQVIGARSRDFLTAASRERAWGHDMPRLRADGQLQDIPLQVVRADGEVRDVLLSATVEYGPDGQMLRSRSVMIDVTDQRRAEANYRDIFENTTEGIYRSTPDGRLLRANPALARLHGCDDERELLEMVRDIRSDWYVDPRARDRLLEQLERADHVENFEAEIHCIRTDDRIWTSENVRAVRDASGAVAYYEGTVRDVTAEYRARRLAARRSEILELIARDASLTGTLYEIVGTVERVFTRMTAAVIRLQDGELHAAAAPALSNACIAAVDGATPSAVGGAVRDALVSDRVAIDSDLAEAGGTLARAAHTAGYGTIAAVPMRDQHGIVLGALATFSQHPVEPDGDLVQLVGEMAQLASIAIEQYRLSEELVHRAQYDVLTDLPNRALLSDRLQQAFGEARRAGHPVAVLLLDLDEFKLVNDTLGHSAGDELLQKVAARLRRCLRESDTVARLGGDEFVLVVPLYGGAEASEVAERVLAALQARVPVADREVTAHPSIGIGLFPQDGNTPETLLQAADTAMYAAKHAGKNRYRYFAEDMNAYMTERLRIDSELREALAADQLELHVQPRVALEDDAIVGAEGLLRWRHPQRGLLGPGEFLAIAERGPLIADIDRWVLRRAAALTAEWQRAGRGLVFSANLSARELHADGFAADVSAILAEAGVDAAGLELEITESMLMVDFERASRQLRDLKERAPGLRIAIDDFGSGYSSLNYLRQLPIDTLKIDRAFVADLLGDEAATASAIVRTIVELGRNLGLTVVGEGVEELQQARLLRAAGCHQVQGFLYAPAVLVATFEQRLP